MFKGHIYHENIVLKINDDQQLNDNAKYNSIKDALHSYGRWIVQT